MVELQTWMLRVRMTSEWAELVSRTQERVWRLEGVASVVVVVGRSQAVRLTLEQKARESL